MMQMRRASIVKKEEGFAKLQKLLISHMQRKGGSITQIPVVPMLVIRIDDDDDDDNERCLISHRTYNITYNIQLILRHFSTLVKKIYDTPITYKDIQGHTKNGRCFYVN